ncbi:MAG: hypothetical protein H0U70_02230 [Tatlockia sp.]|nr:hypothetical protein [Tatlockia sp.]
MKTLITLRYIKATLADISEVFIDPEQGNKRAIHVYQKVGFQIVGDFIASWHPVPHYLMKLDMKALIP